MHKCEQYVWELLSIESCTWMKLHAELWCVKEASIACVLCSFMLQENVCQSVSHFMAFVHSSVNEMSKVYLANERRYNYTTPKSFLELVGSHGASHSNLPTCTHTHTAVCIIIRGGNYNETHLTLAK